MTPRRAIGWLLVAALLVPVGASAAVSSEAAYRMAVAKLLFGEGQYRQALEELRTAVRLEPDEPYLRLELADALFRLGRGQAAVAEVEAAWRLAPQDRDVLARSGQVLLTLAERDPTLRGRGEEAYLQILAQAPDDLESLEALGRSAQRRGDLERAEGYLAQLAALRPGPRTASPLLQVLMEQGKRQEAEVLLRDQLEHDPTQLRMRLSLADLLSEAGAHAESAAVLRGAPENLADEPELARRLAVAVFRGGDPRGALEVLETALTGGGGDPRLRLLRALLYADLGDPARARAHLRELLDDDPRQTEAALSLARLLVQGGLASDAIEVLQVAAEHAEPGEKERVGFEVLQLLAAAERWDQAVSQADALLPTASAELRGAVQLIKIDGLVALGRVEEAAQDLAALGPSESPAIVDRRIEVLLRLGRDDEARPLLAKLSDEPERAVEIYHRAERYAESIPLLETLTAENPESIQFRFLLGAAYERTQQHAQAETLFRALIEAQPDFHLAMNYLGYMWAELEQNLDEALELVERAIELDPDNGAYIDSLGWIYFRLGNYDAALAHLTRASALIPRDGTIQEHLGDVYDAIGNLAEARAAYRRALLLEDGSPNLREKLERVEDVTSAAPER